MFKGWIAPLPHKSNPYLHSSPWVLMGHESIEWMVRAHFHRTVRPLHDHSDVVGMSSHYHLLRLCNPPHTFFNGLDKILPSPPSTFSCNKQNHPTLSFIIGWVSRSRKKLSSCQDRKTNSFICFLGEVRARQICFEICWPLPAVYLYTKSNNH